MKKFILPLTLLLDFTMTACGGKKGGDSKVSESTPVSEESTPAPVSEESLPTSEEAPVSEEESVPAEESEEESIPAEESVEESVPAEESIPAEESEEESIPAEQSELTPASEEESVPAEESEEEPASEEAPVSEEESEAASETTIVVPTRTYYVVGSFNSWTQKDENYTMTVDPDDVNHYTFEGLGLVAGAELKCIDSKGNWYPDGMGNNTKVTEDGVYTVHLRKNKSSSEMTTVERTGDLEDKPETLYYVVGAFNDWAQKDENYLMTQDPSDTNHYSFDDLSLVGGTGMKVMDSNGLWYGAKGADDSDNVVVPETGLYTIDYFVEVDEGDDNIVLTKTGEAEEPSEVSYFLVGGFNSWTAKDENYLMEQDSLDETHYFIDDVTLYEGMEIKVTDSNGAWYGPYGSDDSSNFVIAENGVYTIDFFTAPEDGEPCIVANKTGEAEAPVVSYYLVGSFNGWKACDEDYIMTADTEDENRFYITVDFSEATENIELKVVSSLEKWFGNETDGNVVLEPGEYMIEFLVSVDPGNSHIRALVGE